MNECVLCLQIISEGQRTLPIRDESGAREAHWECMLRSVMGGIGHLEDHQHWCQEVGDPDGGRTYRQSAIEVAEWVGMNA